jgi:glycosyltransferase involved in cell wall biosynthesis
VEQSRALHEAASPVEQRHASRKVCFVGMWGPRKGSRDWAEIIQRVREYVSGAQFSFLGTMVDARVIRAELGPGIPESALTLVSSYQPEDLPRLLADCTVGAFPSYIEGFGLAVIEKLAAGLPTVAYDTAGPRDILEARLPEMLTPIGDIDAFASAICRILLLDLDGYRELAERSREAAAPFAWSAIADATLAAYRDQLRLVSQNSARAK